MPIFPRRSVLIGAALAPAVAPVLPLAKADNSSRTAELVFNVRDYGAIGDGVSDDTESIEKAFAASGFRGPVYFPPGNYLYNGAGLDSPTGGSVEIFGNGRLSTTITLGASSYFLNYSKHLSGLLLEELTFVGGKGVIKHTYAGVNVQQKCIVENCRFKGYTECAIATDSIDMPYWLVRNSFFDGANTTSSIGIALGQGTDQCVIDSCSFIRNRVHIKARAGNNFHVARCDLLQFSEDNSQGPRVSVWIVPSATSVNAGTGLTITGTKFGNENLMAGDFRILYADEGSGASIGERLPELDSDSAGYVRGHNITQNAFHGTGANSHPLIFSTTPNVWELQVHHNVISGGQPSSIVQFRTPSQIPDRLGSNNVFGPFTGTAASTFLPFPVSNACDVGYLQDTQGVLQRAGTVRNWMGGSSASFRECLSTAIVEFSSSSATMTNIPDAFGGPDAVSLRMQSSSASLSSTLSKPFIIGVPVWIEFDVASSGDGNTASQIYALISDDPARIHWRRCVEVPSSPDKGWVTYSFCFTARTSEASTRIVFRATGESESGKSVNLGRIRVYQANERQLGGARPVLRAAARTERDAVVLVNDLRTKLVSLGLVSEASPVEGNAVPDATSAPIHSKSPGEVGQVEWDSMYLYVCIAPNEWKRVPLADEEW